MLRREIKEAGLISECKEESRPLWLYGYLYWELRLKMKVIKRKRRAKETTREN